MCIRDRYTAPDEFQRLVNNLVDNAIKFTSEGSVRIEASKPGSIEPAMIRIEIFDTGMGIPREKNEEIFLPFTQTDSSSTRKYGGAGLGLSVSRQFARLLGGDINVSSQPGRGSTFTVQLPLDSRQYRQSRPLPQDTLSG